MNKYEKAYKILRCALKALGATDGVMKQLEIIKELIDKNRGIKDEKRI